MTISDQQKPIGTRYAPRTDASEIVKDVELVGKTAIVTGGYSGIGLETVRSLASAGAKVIVAGRSMEKAREALADFDNNVSAMEMDLGDLASVRRFAADFLDAHKQLDLLINNAAVMACPEARIGSGWECQFATNHLGHFVLTKALQSALENANGARIVSLSSLGHRRSPIRFDDPHFDKEPYDKWAAYGQSKTANALFAVELDRRLKDKGVRAFAVHPGGIMTPLQRHLDLEEMVEFGWVDENGELSEMAKGIFKTPQQGASTTIWCATNPALDGIGGVYCEDLDIAQIASDDSPPWLHVQPHAVDQNEAAKLWEMSEQLVRDV